MRVLNHCHQAEHGHFKDTTKGEEAKAKAIWSSEAATS